jgi:hypothetical protein
MKNIEWGAALRLLAEGTFDEYAATGLGQLSDALSETPCQPAPEVRAG